MSLPTRFRSWLDRYDVARLVELLFLLLVIADFARVVVRLIGLDAAFHWDESVYAGRARGWVDQETPVSGWSYIRPPAVPLVASLGVLAGGDEWQLRLIGLISGVGLLLAAWWLGRMIAGPIAGVAAAAVLYGGPSLQKESAVLLTDIPSAALLVLVAALLWRELGTKQRPGPLLLVAAAVAGLAFMARYGSILVLVPMLVAATLLWWRRLIAGGWITVGALAIAAIVAIGHAAWSIAQTGSPIGILVRAQSVVPPWEGISPPAAYERWLPFELAGSLGHIALYAGFASIPVAAVLAFGPPPLRRPATAMLLLATTAAVQVVLLVSGVGHVEQRFFALSNALLVIAGVSLVVLLGRLLPARLRVALVVAFGVAVLAYRGQAVDASFARTVQTASYYGQFRIAGAELGRMSEGSCAALSGGYPIVAWYSRCATLPVVLRSGVVPAAVTSADDGWLLVFGRLEDVSLDDPTIAAILELADGAPTVIHDPATDRDLAVAWRLGPTTSAR